MIHASYDTKPPRRDKPAIYETYELRYTGFFRGSFARFAEKYTKFDVIGFLSDAPFFRHFFYRLVKIVPCLSEGMWFWVGGSKYLHALHLIDNHDRDNDIDDGRLPALCFEGPLKTTLYCIVLPATRSHHFSVFCFLGVNI